MMARGGAGAAEPCDDGSAIYENPAALHATSGQVYALGATAIFPTSSFESDRGTHTSLASRTPKVPPHLYLRPYSSARAAVGVGIYTPYGLSTEWPRDFEGRFLSYKSAMRTTYVQPTASFAVTPAISVGAGIVLAMGDVSLYRRADLASVPLGVPGGPTFGLLVPERTDFIDSALTSSWATGVGANLGVTLKGGERWRVGARYLTHVRLDYDGAVAFSPAGSDFRVTKPNALGIPVGAPLDAAVAQVRASLQNQSARTSIDLPAQFVAGVSLHPATRLTVLGDYHWVGWSSFDTVTLDFSQTVPPDEALIQNYRNTSAVHLGMEYRASNRFVWRAGYMANQAAAPPETVTPLLPDAPRQHVTAGIGMRLSRRANLDAAYQFVRHGDRRGRVVDPPAGMTPTTALNSGLFRSRADLLALTVTIRP